jgi:four helix bundle protein
MGDYRDLEAWKSSQALAVAVCRLTNHFPSAERFGLVSQMRRAAVSVVSNIAEGCGRGTDAQLANFLRIARGSVHEVEAQALLAVELGFVQSADIADCLDASRKTGGLIYGLLGSMKLQGSLVARHETRDPRPETRDS